MPDMHLEQSFLLGVSAIEEVHTYTCLIPIKFFSITKFQTVILSKRAFRHVCDSEYSVRYAPEFDWSCQSFRAKDKPFRDTTKPSFPNKHWPSPLRNT